MPKPAKASRSQRSTGRTAASRPKTTAKVSPHVTYALEVMDAEMAAVRLMRSRVGPAFAQAVEAVLACRGHVIPCGVGKPGFIAQKLSATLASIGVPSFYLHPTEAVHGDLGRVRTGDVVIVMSNSGRSEEIVRVLGPLKALGVTLVAITGVPDSPLAVHSNVVLELGDVQEACPLGLAPTASSTAMLVLGDALAMTVSHATRLSRQDFARFHPGGKLGRQLMKVREVMRSGRENPRLTPHATLRHALDVMTNTPGGPGATHVVDENGRLVGILTDGDLRRYLLKARGKADLNVQVAKVMAANPKTVGPDALVEEALRILSKHAIDQVAVVDDQGRPTGLLDIQDVLAVRRV